MEFDWDRLWNTLFGTTEWLGIDMGFWVAIGVTAVIVIIQNLVFWKAFSPYETYRLRHKKSDGNN